MDTTTVLLAINTCRDRQGMADGSRVSFHIADQADSHSDHEMNNHTDASRTPLPKHPVSLPENARLRARQSYLSGSCVSLDFDGQIIDPTAGRATLVRLLSGLYALVLVIMAFAFEVSMSLLPNTSYEPFYIYLFSVGLLYLVYCEIFLLRREGLNAFDLNSFFKRFKTTVNNNDGNSGEIETQIPFLAQQLGNNEDMQVAISLKRKVTHSSPSAGSMFLRLGAVSFGVVWMVGCSLHLLNELENGLNRSHCFRGQLHVVTTLLAMTFTFVQLYFIFLNFKLTIHRFKNVGKFGNMHLVATNLCVWIRSIVIEQAQVAQELAEHKHLEDKIEKLKEKTAATRQNATQTYFFQNMAAELEGLQGIMDDWLESKHHTSEAEHAVLLESCRNSSNLQRWITEIQPFFTTCLIEYSIVAAAVMFILWLNIGSRPARRMRRRKQNLRVDCSAAAKGLFLGLLFVIITVVSMIMFFVKVYSSKSADAMWIFYITDSILYIAAIAGTIIAMYKMRVLRYFRNKERVVMLDDILLLIALVGQLLFCIFGLVAISDIGSLLHSMRLCAFLLRLIQVLLQTILVLGGQRMVAATPETQEAKPGRECITFLLIVNISLWLINTFETQKASSNPHMLDVYGKNAWTIIVHSTVPLCIFHRFHSSVCFAEIWKNAYKVREHGTERREAEIGSL